MIDTPIRDLLAAARKPLLSIEFFQGLAPELAASGVILMLEPNAPGYGADYLTRYSDVVALSGAIGSPWIRPQVDTGCMTMVDEDPAEGIDTWTPAHVHISVPDLLPPPGPIDHGAVLQAINRSNYAGWIVLEMLQTTQEPLERAVESAHWLSATYGPMGQPHVLC